jgi:hypothetical protein
VIEENKKYRIAFATHEPDKFVAGKNGNDLMGKIYFSKDTVCFDTRAELMEFFDNPEKIFGHLRNTDILLMILDKNHKGKKVVPLVEIMPYLQGEGRTRLYFDERREVEIAVDGGKDNKVHNGNIVDSSHQKLFIDGDKQGEWDAQKIKL